MRVWSAIGIKRGKKVTLDTHHVAIGRSASHEHPGVLACAHDDAVHHENGEIGHAERIVVDVTVWHDGIGQFGEGSGGRVET